MSTPLGPAWLGIGAQRCGTTWLTDLLLQHPQVQVVGGRKELHELYRPDVDEEGYRRRFGPGAGEFTPFYLRALWVPPVAARVLPQDAPVIVLLRDPLERFASAMRLEAGRRTLDGIDELQRLRLLRADAQWAGMYATHLDAWHAHFGDRLMVLQYERVRESPQEAVDAIWRRLGLAPVRLVDVDRPSRTTSRERWTWPEGLAAALATSYRREAERLVAWGVDPTLWRTLAAA